MDALGPIGPTSAPAGSFEKLEALRRRQESGLPLWHPDDSQAQAPPAETPDQRRQPRAPRQAPGVADPEE